MAKTKDTRITFRAGDVRFYKITEYQNKYAEDTGQELNNTDFMHMVIDKFLESEEDFLNKEIKIYESMIIKIVTGLDLDTFNDDKEYLKKLKESINYIKQILNS